MIPVQSFTFKEYSCKNCEYNKSYYFLKNLQLHQGKWSSITNISNAIRWNLTRILKKSN